MSEKPITIHGDRKSEIPIGMHVPMPKAGQEWRTPADVDSDRLLYSTEFRRLAGVTQVVPPQDDYVLHDRLTHSLKVAQIASSLAKLLVHESQSKLAMSFEELSAQIDPVVCYAAGLAHDIGHPPFGHAAEVKLQEELKETHQKARHASKPSKPTHLADSFEGNAQSFRIVTRLSFRKDMDLYPADGLDLTWRTLAAIAKYPWLKGEHPTAIAKLANKWSVYDSEREFLEGLRERKLVLEERDELGTVVAVTRSVEAEIMDWSDDIAYAVHDLEDFFRSGRIPLERIRYLSQNESEIENPEWQGLFAYSMSKLKKMEAEEPGLTGWTQDAVKKYLDGTVLTFLPTDPFDGTIRSHEALKQFGSKMIDLLQNASSLKKDGERVNLKIKAEGRIAAEFLKSVTQYYLIQDPSVETMQMGQKRIVGELYRTLLALATEVFITDTGKAESLRRLPVRLREYGRIALEESEREALENPPADVAGVLIDEQIVSRAVVDFLCGLTDKQATLLHEKMTGNPSGGYAASWLSV